MLEQTAVVVRAEADAVWVEAVEPSGCGTCGGHGCGSRRIAELFQRSPRQFRVDSAWPLRAGDRVVVGIEDGSVLKGALRMYGAPLAAMLAGALLAQAAWPGDAAAVGGLVAGGILGLAWARGGGIGRARVLRHESEPLKVMMKGQSC